jgi:hypothetical protein
MELPERAVYRKIIISLPWYGSGMVAVVGNNVFGFDGGMVVVPGSVSLHFNYEFLSGKAIFVRERK